jgi:parallel beta-helix repeat protein
MNQGRLTSRIAHFSFAASLGLVALLLILGSAPASAASFTVDSAADRTDASAGDGICRTTVGTCTVRAAIQEANARGGADTIQVPAGVYELEAPTMNEDVAGTGDYDITDPVTITGAGPNSTILDGGFPVPGASPEVKGLDRIFEVHRMAGDVTITDLTIREGHSEEDGGAVQNWSPGRLRFEDVHLLDSLAAKAGGAINNGDPNLYPCPSCEFEPLTPIPGGRIELIDSRVSGNAASEGGAAINNASTGSIQILGGSEVVDNPGEMIPDPLQIPEPIDPFDPEPPEPPELVPGPGVYEPGGPAIANVGAEDDMYGTIRIADSEVSRNYSAHTGAGVFNAGDGILIVERTTIAGNTSEADGAGLYIEGGNVIVAESTFSENFAHGNGAGLYSGGHLSSVGLHSKVAVSDTVFEKNKAHASGAGILSDGDGDMTLTDVVVRDGVADDAGGGLIAGGRSSLTVVRGAFLRNYALTEGGGIVTASERPVAIAATTVADNEVGVPGEAGVDAAGGGMLTEGGPVTVTGSVFERNTSTELGGGLAIDNHGVVKVADTIVRNNMTHGDGGGVENSGARVTFERLTVSDNRALLDGGGIYNSSSGEFTVLETTMQRNRGMNGGGFVNASDSTLVMRRSLIMNNTARRPAVVEDPEEGGHGGGVYSVSDGDAMIENTTISHNTSNVRGGGMYHDADADFKLHNVTIWRNSAPLGGGLSTVESDFVPSIPPQPNPLKARNTIIAGNEGGNCDAQVTSVGGNIDGGKLCFLTISGTDPIEESFGARDRQMVNLQLDAIADNGGSTLTHATRLGSVAIDNGRSPCPETDQRGVARPQNSKCDSGAFEFEGASPPEDKVPPETEYLSGPVQDTLESVAFHFTGSDNQTAVEDLQYECRLIEHELTEEEEPLAPWEMDPELMFHSCSPGWQWELLEEGLFTFEVRAIDRAGNEDPTPAVHVINGGDLNPPETELIDKPPLFTSSRTATFTFGGTDNVTPAQFLEFECRLDSRDPEQWLECLNPTIFANLTTGEHTLEVRALDGAENMDRTPLRYKWTVGQSVNCDQANIVLTPVADGWVDQVVPQENFLFEQELQVRSAADGSGEPGDPIVPQNARTLVRFPMPAAAPHCKLESATLRLYSESDAEERTLEAVPLAGSWKESTLNWINQPGTLAGSTGATAPAGEGYREWNVLPHLKSMLELGESHGWQIRDSKESDPLEGGEHSFISREALQDPPPLTQPQLVLRYDADAAPPPPPPVPATEPTTVSCGQVITESTLVANDLTTCLGEGLVIGASDIVLDLGGHKLKYGLLLEPGEEEGLVAGVRNSGHTNVVIRNGTIEGFGYGVMLTAGTTRTVVEEMELHANVLAGIELNDADDGRTGNTVRDNLLMFNGESAISIVNSSENSRFIDNELISNGGVGFQMIEASGHRIESNIVDGFSRNPEIDSDGGAHLEGSSDNVFVDNVMSDSGDAGITLMEASNRNRIERDVLPRNGDAGISIQDSDGTEVIDVVAHQGSDAGVVLNNGDHTTIRGSDLRFNPSGVDASDANHLLIEGNDASHSLDAGFEIGNGVNVRVLDNVANQTGGTGISVEGAAFDASGAPVGGGLIAGNTANQNRADGIAVADGGHTVRANDAHNNAGFGVDAGENPTPGEPGEPPSGTSNVDGGNNRASGNEEIEQCRGVVCVMSGSVPLLPEDLTAPEATIDAGPQSQTADTTAVFRFSATDAVTPPTAMVFECRLDPPPDPPFPPEEPDLEPPEPGEPPDPNDPPDGEGWVECVSPFFINNLDEGKHHFEVRALDQADNRDLTPATYDWEVIPGVVDDEAGPDSIEPTTRFAAVPPALTNSPTANFAFAGSDNLTRGHNLRYECSLDGASFVPCTSPQQHTVGAGQHSFEARAIDRAGNVDSSPAKHVWTYVPPPVDSTPPQTTIESGPDPVGVKTTATFTFSSDEQGVTFECSLNGGAYGPCASPQQLTGLTVRLHELSVRARDAAGNADPSPATWSWAVAAPPVPTFVACGQVLTQSTLVRNDLGDCLFDGLVIGADNIVVDLDGHLLDGKGIGAGIRNKGFDNVTIRNGRTSDFDWGVALNNGTKRNIVEAMRVELSQEAGIGLGPMAEHDPNLPVEPPDPFPSGQSGVSENTVRGNTVVANRFGIWLTRETKGSLIQGNQIAATSGEGVFLENSSNNRVLENQVDNSSGAGVGLEGSSFNTIADNVLTSNDAGVTIDVTRTNTTGIPSNDNRVEGNALEETGGFEVIESSRNELVDNVVQRANDSGVHLEYAQDNLVRGNDVRGNKGGITLKAASGNRIEENDASESESTGIALEALSLSNVLLRNTSSSNEGDGIYVGDETAGSSGTLIEGNVTNDNKGYGIFVPKVSHTIKGNVANDNGGWGIWASEGSNGRFNVDAGGNRAQGNLGPPHPVTFLPQQCWSVSCEGGPPVSVDLTPPETTLIDFPADPSTDTMASFRFAGTDSQGNVTFQCSIDGSAFAPCTSPTVYSGLAIGAHAFTVRAVDVSGNVDLSPEEFSWGVGVPPVGVPPQTTIESGPDPVTVSTDADFEVTADERGSTFECSLDGAPFTPCLLAEGAPGFPAGPESIRVSYGDLAVGTHSFRVRATDSQFNTDDSPAIHSWRIEPPPTPAEVSCGEVLVQSTRVTNDLVDCLGHGLIVGAPNITVDLDGHVIDGKGLDSGILNNGHDGVTIANGHVHEFAFGVLLNPGTADNVLTGLRVEQNDESGITLSDADQGGKGNAIRGNTLLGNDVGVGLFGGTNHAVVRGNQFGASGGEGVRIEHSAGNRVLFNEISKSSGAGIAIAGGANNAITDNVLTDNHSGGILAGEELLPANNTLVEENTLEGNEGAGIEVVSSTGSQVLFNEVTEGKGAAVVLELANDVVVRGNDLSSNAAGVEMSESNSNLIEQNNASGQLGSGIEAELSSNNDIVRNTASGNGGEGIEISDSALTGAGNLIERNITDSNGGDGIIVEGAGHTITENRAQMNGGWGIYAPVGAIDGGGNLAAGNVEPGQCLGVVCQIGEVAGAPQTTIVEGPPSPSNSRNASFTYTGFDNTTPLHELVFECRVDSKREEAWEDCEYPYEVRNLNQGQHTVEIRAVDVNEIPDATPAAHTWIYQPLPPGVGPQVTLDMVPEPESWALEALFTFHANEPDVAFECRVDTEPFESCGFEAAGQMSRGGFEWGLEEEEVGPHTFRVRATDFEGNVGPVTSYTWSLFGVLTSFTSGPGFTPASEGEPATGGETTSSNATIDFEANVGDATFECSLDLEPFASCTPPVTYTGLSQGDHELRVIATDVEGGEEVEPAVYEWEVLEFEDTNPPETSIERAPADGSSSTKFEFVGSDDLTQPAQLRFECRLDSSNALDWEECESPFNLLDIHTYEDPQMAPGPHRFEVRAIDMADPEVPDPSNPDFEGNVDPTPAVRTWTSVADTTPPTTAITLGPLDRTGEDGATFEFAGSDSATPDLALEYQCSLDGAPFEPCDSPESVSSLEPGEHTMRIRSVDLAGNADQTPAARTWTIVPAPVTTITSGPGAISTSESAIFVFSANQVGSTFECSLDGAEFAPCASPEAFWVVSDGSHELEIRATNPEGVVEDPPASFEWTAELGPDVGRPDTQVSSGPPASTTNTIATFTFTGSDNRTLPAELTFECSLDGSGFSSCSSPEEFSDLGNGQHVLLVRARDEAGNFDLTPARYEWSVEPPPTVTILSAPDEIDERTTVSFTFTSDVPGAVFECWLDGVLKPCTSGVTYTDLVAGEHLFAVRGINAGGAIGQWEEHEWETGDGTAPITTITSGPDFNSETNSAEFTFTANESGVTYVCSLDDREPTPCESPVIFPKLHPGPHSFEVTALSPMMLVDPVPTVYEWTIVDNEPPETSIAWGPRASTESLTAVFGFSSDDPTAIFECSLDGEGFSECDEPTEYTDLERGPHRLQVRARDFVGNVDPTPASHEWMITQPGPPNTPVGTNVVVEIPMPDLPRIAKVTFAEVDQMGSTIIDQIGGGPELPPGYGNAGGRFYNVSTSAEFSDASICLAYEPGSFSTTAVRLLESDGGEWLDVTTLNNPFTGVVCGLAENFTTYAIATASSSTAPLVSIISGPPMISLSSSATFEFISDSPDTAMQCSLDGEPFEHCSSPKTYNHLEEGDHELLIQAMSEFGIVTQPSLYEWEVVLPPDVTPPETQITKGPGAVTSNYISLFEFSGTDDQTGPLEMEFECSLDGGQFEDCENPEEIEVFTVGEHTLRARALDEAGNFDPTPAVRKWTVVDISAPDTSIDEGPNDETQETTATFTFSGEEPDGTAITEFQCALDGADFAPCSSPHTVSGLSDGIHLMLVRAVDPAGNVDPIPDFYEWQIIGANDSTPPETTIAAKPPALSGPDVIFGFTSNEAVEEFECSLDGAAFSECEGLYDIEGLETGEHTLRVRAVDIALNVDPTPASYTWGVLGEPDTFLESTPPDPSASTSGNFTFSSDQEGVTFQCSVDGSEFTPCSSPFIAGPLENHESHTFEVRAVSPFENLEHEQIVDESPASYEWHVNMPPDTPPPTTTLLSTPPAVNPGGEDALYDFSFKSDDLMAGFECSLDEAPFEECESPAEYDNLAEGEHVFRVRAVDLGEVVDPTPAEFSFTIEPAGETTILSGPEPITDATTADFSFETDRAGYSFECSLDGESYGPCTASQTYTDVPYGQHELLVRARGPFGSIDQTPAMHEWESGHLTPPPVVLLTTPEAETPSASATFSFESSDSAAVFQCSLDGAPFVPCSSPKTYADLVPGQHDFVVRATKPHLLEGPEEAAFDWIILDADAPMTLPISGPLSPVLITEEALFLFGGLDDGTAPVDLDFECSLDDGAFEPCDSPHTVGGMGPGQHNLAVRAIDLAGNVDPTPESTTWTVIGPPATTITTGPDPSTLDTTARFEFAVDQEGSTHACSLDGGELKPCVSPVEYTHLAVGEHVFEVRATNSLGLIEEPPAAYEWTVEPPPAEAPTVTIDVAPVDPSSSPSASFEFSADQAGTSFECSLNDSAFEPCDSPHEYTGLGDRIHVFAVRGTNTDEVTGSAALHEWEVDLPPETTIDQGPPAQTVDVFATFGFSSDDPAATFECSLDAPADEPDWGSCEATYEIEVEVGDHELQVRAKDEAGNVDPSPEAYQWTVNPLPETMIDSAPSEQTSSRTASFEFSSDRPGASFECSLDEAAFEPCSSPKTYEDLPFEDHDFEVRAVDAQGNRDSTPAEHSWEIGHIPPPVTIESGPDATTESKSATFSFSADDSVAGFAGFECSLDGSNFSSCFSPRTFSGLLPGPHRFEVRATVVDPIVEPEVETYEWTVVDQTAPDTEIEFGPDDPTGSQIAAFGLTSEAGATFECSLDGAAFAACESPVRYEGVGLGEHQLRARAVDAAGNADPTPATYDWTVVGPPDTTVAGPEQDVLGTSAEFTFSSDQAGSTFECSLDNGPFEDCDSPHTVTGLIDGDHFLTVRARNSLGISDPEPAEFEFAVDLVPDTRIDLGPEATTTETAAIFLFSSNELDVEYECALDGAAFTECEQAGSAEGSHIATGLDAGLHELLVRAVDGAGHVDPTPASHEWTVLPPPNTPEGTDVTVEVEAPSGSTSASLTFPEVTDAGMTTITGLAEPPALPAGYQVGAAFFDLETTADYTPPIAVCFTYDPESAPPSGMKLLHAEGGVWTDVTTSDDSDAGIVCGEVDSLSPFAIAAEADTAAPQTAIDSGPDAETAETEASLAFSADEPGSSFECSLDGAAFSACTSPKPYANLALGAHSFRVRATDQAGNADQTPAERSWTVIEPPDTAAPQTAISAAPSSGESQSASFSFSANEPSTFQCALDGSAFAPCGSPKSYSGLAVGNHSFQVRAVDVAGNIDASPASHAWTISAPPPPPPPSCTASTVTLSANADSWVLQSSAGQNYGQDSVLKVDTKSATNARALVRFNLPSIPAGCTVTNAKLRLYATSYKSGRTLKAHRLASSWTESNVRWNNQPDTAGAAATTTSGSGYREWLVTSQLQSMYVEGNFGFIVRDVTENGTGFEQAFHSREKKESPPRLVITFG